MKKFIFLVMVIVFTLAFSSAAFATHDGESHDVDAPKWADNDPGCMFCHGPVEDNFAANIIHSGAATQTLTLRNIIRFENLYALKVFKVENSVSFDPPTLDLGSLDPDNPASGYFWTHVFSNADYTETFTWSDFSNGGVPTIPASRMTVKVTDAGAPAFMTNPGTHGAPHNATPDTGNWERIDLTVDTEYGDPAGTGWDSTLDIVVAQQ